MGKPEITDLYALAQYGSLWAVVIHATDTEADRYAAYEEAGRSMIEHGRWGPYHMQYHTLESGHRLHVGYRYANPKDWMLLSDAGEIDGPFPSKKLILHKLRVKASTTVQAGVYLAKAEDQEYTIFTRDEAATVGLTQEELP